MRIKPASTSVVGVALLLTACGGGGGSTEKGDLAPGVSATSILIGTSTATTGLQAVTCKSYADGAQAWFDRVNKDGGVHGRTIKFEVKDDNFKAPEALANARELASEPVLAFFGGCGSIQSTSIQTIAAQNNIPNLFNFEAVPEVREHKNVRTLLPLYADQFTGITEWAMKKQGPGSAFLVIVQNGAAKANEKGMKDGVAAGGGTVVGNESFAVGEDLSAMVLKIKQAKPKYVIMSIADADLIKLLTGLKAQNALDGITFLTQNSGLSDNILQGIKGMDGYQYFATSITALASDPRAQDCNTALTTAGLKPDAINLFGCGAAQTLVAALKDSGDNPTREGLLKALDGWRAKEVGTALPPLTFDAAKGHLGVKELVVATIDGGEFKGQGNFEIK